MRDIAAVLQSKLRRCHWGSPLDRGHVTVGRGLVGQLPDFESDFVDRGERMGARPGFREWP
jgi:hypothetical protein